MQNAASLKQRLGRTALGISLCFGLALTGSVASAVPAMAAPTEDVPAELNLDIGGMVPSVDSELPSLLEASPLQLEGAPAEAVGSPTGSALTSVEVTAASSASQIEADRATILRKTNEYRGQANVKPVTRHEHLDKIAQDWAVYMAETGLYGHNPNVVKQVFSKKGWGVMVSENVAYGFHGGSTVTDAWYKSEGHRRNMLSSAPNHVGIGVAYGGSNVGYFVQVFSHKTPDKPTGPPVAQPVQKSQFADVKSGHKFYKEIEWMGETKLSTGVNTSRGKEYQPKNKVSREAMAAFLYRMEAPKNYKAPQRSPFVDVSTKHKFYKEIAWMHSSKISTGTKVGKGKYAYYPKSSVSREAMAAFLYRMDDSKKPQASKSSPFSDVKPGQKFYKEIAWMYSSKISTGTSIGKGRYAYHPKSSVSREAMAAFLYRFND